MSNVVKKGILHTAAGKVIAGVATVCVVGAAVGGVMHWTQSDKSNDAKNQKNVQVAETQSVESQKVQKEEVNSDGYKAVADEQYPELLAGNLSKEQLSFVLATAPGMMSDDLISEEEMNSMMNYIAMGSTELEGNVLEIRSYGTDENGKKIISAEDTNRLLSVLTDYRFTEENDSENVQGDNLLVSIAGGINVSAEITSAEYKRGKMRVYYEYSWHSSDGENEKKENRLAILSSKLGGNYQVEQIWTYQTEADLEKIENGDWNWKMAYKNFLADAPNKTFDTGYDVEVREPKVSYRLYDMDADAVPELIMTAFSGEDGIDTLSMRECLIGIYTYNEKDGMYLLGRDVYETPGIVKDEANNQLIIYTIDAFLGDAKYYAMKREGNSLTQTVIYEGQFPTLDYVSTYNSQCGYTDLEESDGNDYSQICYYANMQ